MNTTILTVIIDIAIIKYVKSIDRAIKFLFPSLIKKYKKFANPKAKPETTGSLNENISFNALIVDNF